MSRLSPAESQAPVQRQLEEVCLADIARRRSFFQLPVCIANQQEHSCDLIAYVPVGAGTKSGLPALITSARLSSFVKLAIRTWRSKVAIPESIRKRSESWFVLVLPFHTVC
jgi:hypothetical protein